MATKTQNHKKSKGLEFQNILLAIIYHKSLKGLDMLIASTFFAPKLS